MGRRSYSGEKRRKELGRKAKQEAKRQKRLARKQGEEPQTVEGPGAGPSETSPTSEPAPPS